MGVSINISQIPTGLAATTHDQVVNFFHLVVALASINNPGKVHQIILYSYFRKKIKAEDMGEGSAPRQPHSILLSYKSIIFNADISKNMPVLIKLFREGASYIAQSVKNLPAMQATPVQFPGRENPLEKEMATHSSFLA